MWFTGSAVEPLPMQDVFGQQRRRMLQTSSGTEQDTSPPPDVHRQLCANVTSQQQQQCVAKLHLTIDMAARQLGVRLPIQNLIKPVESSAVGDTAVVAPVSLPDFCSDWDLPIAAEVEAHERPPCLPELVPRKFECVVDV